MRHRPLAAVLLLSTLFFTWLLYLRFRSYDLVSIGLCRVAPFSSPCTSAPGHMLSPSASEISTHKSHSSVHSARTRGRISLSIGSINIRFARDATYDSTHTVLSSLEHMLAAARRPANQNAQFPSSLDSLALRAGSPYLMRQYGGERSWRLRGPKIADTVLFGDWDVFALQEVLDGQYDDLVHWLGDEYDHAGVGRDDGKRAGEAVPVFWRRDTFELVNRAQGGVGEGGVEHFWLSDTPEVVGSVGWDAALTRMCTHVSLRLLATREIVHVFSTHYDHQGVRARAKSSELIVKRARAAAAHTKRFHASQASADSRSQMLAEPLVVLIGDLNSPRNEGSWSTLVSPHYGLEANSTGATFLDTALSVPTRLASPLLTDNEDPRRSELASGRTLPPAPSRGEGGVLSEPVGPLRTFSDFSPSPRNAIDDRIDFIMLLDNSAVLDESRPDARLDHSPSPPPPENGEPRVHWLRDPLASASPDSGQHNAQTKQDRWRIRTFGTLPNWSEGDAGFLISDHRPVTARIQRTFSSA